ncbi:MAG: radical SAM protein, partial [Candidatus Colwellbacteria bacterium]|nr:radical SAM protein [Candidatus Colwellbacteria bacterium]
MIKSPPLDIANLIAVLKKYAGCNIKLSDLRKHVISNDGYWGKNGIDTGIFDDFAGCFKHILTHENPRISQTCRKILKKCDLKDINIAVFSVAVLEQFCLQYLVSSLCLAKELKKNRPGIKIMYFGNCPRGHARMLMRKVSFIDAFLEDGNEFSVLAYVTEHKKGRAIPGICLKTGRRLLYTNQKRKFTLNKYPLPDFSLFDLKSYKSNGTLVLPYEISKGCINNCFFCYYIHKNRLYYKDIGKATDDLTKLSKIYNTEYFHFMDAAINFNNYYLEKLCASLKEHLPGIKWSALAIPNIGYPLLEKMKGAGCNQLRWGVEYGSARMLGIIAKKTTPVGIYETLKNAHSLSIFNYITLLSGIKQETKRDLEETKKFIRKIAPYVDAAQECVWGELGHFSILQLEKLLDQKGKYSYALPAPKYAPLLKKLNIYPKDIIEAISAKKSVGIIIAPCGPQFNNAVAQDDGYGRAMLGISNITARLDHDGVKNIEYYDFSLLLSQNPGLRNRLEQLYLTHKEEKTNQIILKILSKLIEKKDYFVFYVLWWNRNLEASVLLSGTLKKIYPDSKIIFVGPYCGLYHKEIMEKSSSIDYLTAIDPEEPLSGIILGESPLEKIPGLIHHKGHSICKHKDALADLSNREFMVDYTKHLKFIKKYKLPSPCLLDYETSRGCRYSCFFCASISGKKPRLKEIPFIVSEIRHLQRSTGINNYYSLDDALNFDNTRLKQLCRSFINSGIKINWS